MDVFAIDAADLADQSDLVSASIGPVGHGRGTREPEQLERHFPAGAACCRLTISGYGSPASHGVQCGEGSWQHGAAAPVTSIREGMRCHDWITVLGASAMATATAVRCRCADGTGRARRGARGRRGARRRDGFVLEGNAQPECQAPARSARGRVLCHRPGMRRRRQLDR